MKFHSTIFLKKTIVLSLFVFSIGVVVSGIESGRTGIPIGDPITAYVILAVALGLLFDIEGVEIGVTALSRMNLNDKTRENHPMSSYVYKVIMSGNNFNFFLIGRQLIVILTVFIIAGLTSSETSSLFGLKISSLLSLLLYNLGLCGALLTFWMAQIPGKILAGRDPIKFLDLPFQILLVQVAIFIGKTGLWYPAELLIGKGQEQKKEMWAPCCSFSCGYDNHNYFTRRICD